MVEGTPEPNLDFTLEPESSPTSKILTLDQIRPNDTIVFLTDRLVSKDQEPYFEKLSKLSDVIIVGSQIPKNFNPKLENRNGYMHSIYYQMHEPVNNIANIAYKLGGKGDLLVSPTDYNPILGIWGHILYKNYYEKVSKSFVEDPNTILRAETYEWTEKRSDPGRVILMFDTTSNIDTEKAVLNLEKYLKLKYKDDWQFGDLDFGLYGVENLDLNDTLIPHVVDFKSAMIQAAAERLTGD